MTYVLHYAPDNASLIVRLALEEMGLPYRTALVDRRAKAQASPAYRQINPAGLIPALETPDGPLFETAAILLWLADRHGAMAPLPDAPGRGAFLSRLFFTSNTLHAQLRQSFCPWKYVGEDAQMQAQLRATLQAQHARHMTLPNGLSLLDAHYRSAEGQPRTILCLYVAAILRWCALYPAGGTEWFDIRRYPALWHLAQDLEARPAALSVARAEGLGETPFSAPQPPNPPEGSAL